MFCSVLTHPAFLTTFQYNSRKQSVKPMTITCPIVRIILHREYSWKVFTYMDIVQVLFKHILINLTSFVDAPKDYNIAQNVSPNLVLVFMKHKVNSSM